jgi:hypothetical protein
MMYNTVQAPKIMWQAVTVMSCSGTVQDEQLRNHVIPVKKCLSDASYYMAGDLAEFKRGSGQVVE